MFFCCWQNGHVSNSCSFICCYYYCLAECFVLTIMSPSDDISGYKGCKKILLAKSKRRNHPTKQFHNLFFNLKNLKHKISQYSKTSENIDQCETYYCSGGRVDPWIGATKNDISISKRYILITSKDIFLTRRSLFSDVKIDGNFRKL